LLGSSDDVSLVEAPARMTLDLSSTDEAAWPRLIALAASELAEQRFSSPRAATSPVRTLSPQVKVVSFDVKTTKKHGFMLTLGGAFSRLGERAVWLMGPSVGAQLHVGRVALLGTEVRVQWGQSTLAEANVDWQLASASAFGGLRRKFEPIEVSGVLGLRVGQLRLTGEAKTAEESGRKLVGPTGGPLLGIRLRTTPVSGVFVGAHLEAGYTWWSVQGTYDNTAPLVTVDGVWTSAAIEAGLAF
jgi:hypothetical protein